MYDAIADYSMNFNEQKLEGVPKALFTLIKPQLDANIKKFKNGTKPKTKQTISKPEASDKQKESKPEGNVNDNANVNVNHNEKVNVNPLVIWIKTHTPRVQQLKHPITNEEAERIIKEFDKVMTKDVFKSMENHKNLLKNYLSANSTFRNWAAKRIASTTSTSKFKPNL